MAISPARQLAREVLTAVELDGGYASELLRSSRAAALGLADRRLATEIAMGVLRWRAQLDYVIERAARRPAARIAPPAVTALRMGVYQLRFLSRVPASAAVHESVEMVKQEHPRLAGFVNAVLRHASREPMAALLAEEPDPARRRAIEFSHPLWLLERWGRNYGAAAADGIAEFDNDVPPVAMRLPAGEAPGAELTEALTLAPGRLLASALRVTAGDVTKTAAFASGRLLAQDEASQLMAYLLEPGRRDHILDACAAPGGKTAILAELAPEGLVAAVELHPRRARQLGRRLEGRGERVRVVVADASRRLPFRPASFDRVLVDAPCTGTGTLARNPEIRWRLAAGDPARLARLQGAILDRTVEALRPGGRLVYSVCSIEPEEGPEVIAALLARQAGLSLVPVAGVLASLRAAGQLIADPAGLCAGPYLRILPGGFATDGFFAAVLERAR